MPAPQCTTHCIYRIVCFQTGKVYVGQTTNVKIRRYVHFYDLSRGYHHNNYLQYAYNKWGASAFYFEVLESGIAPEKINERETHWIAHFDSFHNGYNATPGGQEHAPNGKPCVWNGTTYSSIRKCAEAWGLTRSAMLRRLRLGYTCDADMVGAGSNQAKAVVCIWNGIEYPSAANCDVANGLNLGTTLWRIKRGYTCDEDVKEVSRSCIWNGVKYSSVSAAAIACNVSLEAMRSRVDNGNLCDEDVGTSTKRVTCRWNGIDYSSIREAANANNISHHAMKRRLRKGYSCDTDIPDQVYQPSSKTCTWNSVTYPSISEAARANGLGFQTLHYRIKQGYTCDEDIR